MLVTRRSDHSTLHARDKCPGFILTNLKIKRSLEDLHSLGTAARMMHGVDYFVFNYPGDNGVKCLTDKFHLCVSEPWEPLMWLQMWLHVSFTAAQNGNEKNICSRPDQTLLKDSAGRHVGFKPLVTFKKYTLFRAAQRFPSFNRSMESRSVQRKWRPAEGAKCPSCGILRIPLIRS